MCVIGISEANQNNIFRLLAAILHIGNMTFHEEGKGNAEISVPQGE
jgi:myosin-1